MTDLQKRFEQVVGTAQRKLIRNDEILPIKTHEGILVGSVKIVSRDTFKDLWQFDHVVYENIYLNKVAIKLANVLARERRITTRTETIYKADQEYGRLLYESLLLRERLHRAKKNGEYEKADIFLARYTVAKDRANFSKLRALALTGL